MPRGSNALVAVASDRGTHCGSLDDMVLAASVGTLLLVKCKRHVCDDNAFGAHASRVSSKALADRMASSVDKLGVTGNLDICRPQAALLTPGEPVVMADPRGRYEQQPAGDPALHQELGEVLPGKV